MITIHIRGKLLLATKDFLFFIIAGFMIGFGVALGIYTGNILLAVFLVAISLLFMVIYTWRLTQIAQEIAKEVNLPDTKKESKKVINIEAKKFFEA